MNTMRPLALALTLLLATTLCGAELKLTPKEAGSIKSHDLTEVQANSTVLTGELIKVKFTYRLPDTLLLDEGKLKGTVGYSVTNVTTGASKTASMVVIVPKEGRSWFMKISTTATSRKPNFAFARLKINETIPELELLGRELKSNLKGPQIVWE